MAKQSAVLDIPVILNTEYEMVPVTSLKCHPRNVRQGDLGAIVESIKANGFYGACVVQRSTRFILVGNHRFLGACEARIPAVPVVWVDCDNDRALRIMLSDNQTSDVANNNPSALAELLAELANSPLELSGTGFDGDDLDQLIADLADKAPKELLQEEDETEKPDGTVECPQCGYILHAKVESIRHAKT